MLITIHALLTFSIALFCAYFIFKITIKKWYGVHNKNSNLQKTKYWLGVISCFSIAIGLIDVIGELLFLIFGGAIGIGFDINKFYNGIFKLIIFPLIFIIVGLCLNFLIGSQKSKVNTNLEQTNNNYLEIVLKEISEGKMHRSTWAESFLIAEGNEAKAKVEYLKIRIEQLSNGNSEINKIENEQSNTIKKLSAIDRILKDQKTNFKIIYKFIKLGIIAFLIIMSIIITILFSISYLNKNKSNIKNTIELKQQNFTFLNCVKCIDGICNNENTSFEIEVVPSSKVIVIKNNLIKSSLMKEVNSKEDCTFNKNTYEFYCRIINENKQFNEITEIKFDGFNIIKKSQTLFNERTSKVSNIDLTCIGNEK
jgi:hypothetical protein